MAHDKKPSVELNYIYNLIYQMLIVIVPLVTTPYVSRVLNADGIGAYSYTYSISTYFALLTNLGITTYGQLQISSLREKKSELSKVFFELLLLKGILAAFVLLGYSLFVFSIKNDINRNLLIVLITHVLSSIFDITWFLQGLEQFKKIVVRNILIKFGGVILVFLTVKTPNDLYVYALVLGLSNLIGNLSVLFFVPRYIEKVPFAAIDIRKHLIPCLIYFIPTIATTVYLTLDKTMIGWYTTSSFENGYYEQAHKIEQIAVTVLTSLSMVTMPRMAYLFSVNEEDRLRKRLDSSFQFILMLSIPMCFGLIGISERFIPIFLGPGFERSIPLLKIFAVLMIVVGLDNAFGRQIIMPAGKQKEYNIGVISGAVCNLLMNSLLIPRFLSIGAAIASVVAEIVVLSVFMYYSRDYITLRWVVQHSWKYLISGIIMYSAMMFMDKIIGNSWISLAILIIASICIYFCALLLLKDDFLYSGAKKLINGARRENRK